MQRSRVPVKAAVLRWRDAEVRPKKRAKRLGILEAHARGDVADGQVRVGQQRLGPAKPCQADLLKRRATQLAAELFHEPAYLKVAEASGLYFYETFVRRGFTVGGPGEVLQCPDSKSAFAVVESMVVLREATVDARWTAMARDAANLFASWVVSYDFAFPADRRTPSTGRSWWTAFTRRNHGPRSRSTCTTARAGVG